MELTCPSCGSRHRSEDFPDAFEIQCSCGYAILVPELQVSASGFGSSSLSEGFDGAPVALEGEDEKLLVHPDEHPSDEGNIDNMFRIEQGMTPPEELPPTMPYDPFELSDLDQSPQDTNDNLEADVASNETSAEGQKDEAAIASPAQELIERSQLASLGQLLGFSYDLEWSNMKSEDQRSQLKMRAMNLIKHRPWLEAELTKRSLDLASLDHKNTMINVPEPLALEIYMAVFELGGQCQFKPSGS